MTEQKRAMKWLELEFEPEKRDNAQLVVGWPSKEEMLLGRDIYLSEHTAEVDKFFTTFYPFETSEWIALLARLYLESVYSVELMRKISPLPLTTPLQVKPDFFNWETMSTKPVYGEGGVYEGLGFCICIPRLTEVIEGTKEKLRRFRISNNISLGKEKVSQEVSEYKRQLVEELDADYLSAPVHEWGHLLYWQEIVCRGSRKRIEAAMQNNLLWRMANTGVLSEDQFKEWYLSLDMEYRGRLWEKEFLQRYFPESERMRIVRAELEFGKKVRMEKLGVRTAKGR